MANIEFTRSEKEQMAQKVKKYFHDELDQEIGGFDAEFLIDFFAKELGTYFYNRGLYDAEALIADKMQEVSELVVELEKPLP